MAKESVQKKLQRVRPPRVQIEYEVETGDATVKKELPFVVGVVGDFSGDPTQKLDPLSKRKFIDITRDNFDEVLGRMTPGLNLRVDNKLDESGGEMSVQLEFKSMEDFEPTNVAKQVKPLQELLETREKLRELQNKMDGNEELEGLLDDIIKSSDKLTKLSSELGSGGDNE